MHMNKRTQPSVCADYADSHNNPDTSRCRFIAHTADLSAFRGFHNTPLHVFISIIGPNMYQPKFPPSVILCHPPCHPVPLLCHPERSEGSTSLELLTTGTKKLKRTIRTVIQAHHSAWYLRQQIARQQTCMPYLSANQFCGSSMQVDGCTCCIERTNMLCQ
jgi:hypothetical protein